MAYRKIDDGAWTTTDSGPLASAHSVTLRNNLEQCSDERAPATAIVYPPSEPLRLCSYFQSCVGPYFIYLPPEEDFDSLTVTARISDVVFDGESAGATAIYLYATIGDTNQYIERPPALRTGSDPWLALDSGDSGSYQIPTSSIGVDNANKVSGWVPVFLWFWSVQGSTAADGGTGSSTVTFANRRTNAVKLHGVGSTPSTPPEQLLVIEPKFDKNQNDPFANDTYQFCLYDDSDDWAEVAPLLPASGYYYGSHSNALWSSYHLGVALVESVSIRATPAPFQPDASPFYSGEPAAEQWLYLGQQTDRMINQRTQQWSCSPGPDSYVTGSYSRPLPMLSIGTFGFTGHAPLDTDWAPLMGALVVAAPPDDNGYEGIISLMLLRQQLPDPPATWAAPGDLELRLAAYIGGSASPGSAMATGEAAVINADELTISTVPSFEAAMQEDVYSPARHAIIRSASRVDWQFRGYLNFHNMREASGRHDWSYVSNIELPPLPPDDLTYPIRVVIEARLTADWDAMTTAVIGGGIRSRDRD